MRRRVLPLLFASAIGLAACGGGSSNNSSKAVKNAIADLSNSSTTTDGSFGSNTNSLAPHGPAIGRIRVANLITVNGQPGPAIDVYDTSKPASTDVALVKGLQYGAVSDYVTPHAFTQGDTTTNLYVFPAGSLTTTELLNGSNVDNSGFESGDQMTIALTAASAGSGLGSQQLVEAGSRMGYGSVASAPSGMGVLMVRDTADNSDSAPEQYLVVNGKCPSPDPQGGSTHPSTIPVTIGDSTFTLAPGTYTLGVATSPRGSGLTTCKGKTQSGTTKVTIADGQRVDVFVYGDPKAPSIVTAAVS